jgi:hypothetical protein
VAGSKFPWGIVAALGGAAVIASSIRSGSSVPGGGWRGPVPRGKGIWIYDLDDAKGPQNLAERCEWLGLSWVMVSTHRIEADGTLNYTDTRAKRDEHIAALRERGISVAFWGWPRPAQGAAFADVAAQLIADHKPAGFVVNAEQPWLGGSHGSAALSMMKTIRDALGPDRGLAMSSYGAGKVGFSSFPWDEFALHSDIGMPQIYDMYNTLGPEYPARSMQRWGAMFPAVVPVWSAGPSKTAATMRQIQDRTPLDALAASWWSFTLAISSVERAGAIRSYSLSRPNIA